MSYMRGKTYVWVGGDDDNERVNIWSEEEPWHQEPYRSSVSLPIDEFDELVVMRMAELKQEGILPEVIERARQKWAGNGGCVALMEDCSG
jgi:hypothetical protein